MRIKEVYDISVPLTKRKEEKMNFWVSLAVRPLSVFLTAPLVNTKVKPITITKLSILFLVAGFILVSLNLNIFASIGGWFCFFVWAILDGVDGNLARCQGTCSSLGDLWDTMGGYAAMVLIYYSAGIASFLDKSPALDFFKQYSYLLLVIGGLTSVFSIFPRLILHKKKSSNVDSESVKSISDKKNYSFSKIIAMNLVSPSGFMQIIFLACLIFHVLNFFVCFYFVVNLGIMLLSLYSLLRESR